MEFAILTARVDTVRQVFKEIAVEGAAREGCIELLRVDAGDVGAKTARDHVVREAVRRHTLDRKQGRDTGAVHILFPIGTDILKEQIAEGEGLDAFALGVFHKSTHALFIVLLGAGPGDVDHLEPSEGASLFAQAIHGPATQVVPAFVDGLL